MWARPIDGAAFNHDRYFLVYMMIEKLASFHRKHNDCLYTKCI